MLLGFDPRPKPPTPSFDSILGTGTGMGSSTEFSSSSSAPLSPPTAPDFSELEDQLTMIPSRFSPARATASYDRAIEGTQAITGQLANNAANIYAQRQMRLGINPVAAGAVRAQTQLAGNRQVNDMKLERDKYQQEVKGQAASLSAQISANLAQLRESYSRTLAEFNIQQASLHQKDSQFATTASLDERRLADMEKELELKLSMGELEKNRLAKTIKEEPTGQANRLVNGAYYDVFGNDAYRSMLLGRG